MMNYNSHFSAIYFNSFSISYSIDLSVLKLHRNVLNDCNGSEFSTFVAQDILPSMSDLDVKGQTLKMAYDSLTDL